MKTRYKAVTVIVLGIVFISTGFGVLYLNPDLIPDPRIPDADRLELTPTTPSSSPEPERDPIPEGDYLDKNIYVDSVNEAQSIVDFKLSIPQVPEEVELDRIKISSDKRKATLYYSNSLEIAHHPMGRNFNNAHYAENPEREEGKVFYDFDGTFAEGLQVMDPFYSVITIHRDDRIYVKATMETGLDELLKMVESMDIRVPHVPYTPDPDYVIGYTEPETNPEPEPEPELISEEENIRHQKQNQAKLQTQKEIVIDYRGNQHQIDAINKYREDFEPGYFLEQFILSNKQNFEKDEVMNFIVVQWGYQPQECSYSQVIGYFKPYSNYEDYFYAEKISEWEKPKDLCRPAIYSDSNGYVIVDMRSVPGIPDEHQTCNEPGEYRILVRNLKDKSQVQWGYYTCQRDKLAGEPQPWMSLPE